MTYQDRADHLALLIEDKLGVRGTGLEAKLRHAGRLLPKHVQRDGRLLVEAAQLQHNPKLARQLEAAKIERAYRNVETYLAGIDPAVRRWNRIIGFLSANAFNLLATGAAVVVVLVWRDLI